MNPKQEWVDSLQEGDKVAVNIGSFNFSNFVLLTIEKITPKRIIKTSRGYSFNKNGLERGNDDVWGGKKELFPVTDDILQKIEQENLLITIGKVKFSDLPLETLREIVKTINQ